MKRLYAGLAVILLLLGVVGQSYAGYTIKPKVARVNGTGQAILGSSNVKAINVFSTVAGDRVAIYAANISAGPLTVSELEFEIGISANNSSVTVYTGTDGLDLGSIYVASSNESSVTSIVYDY